MKNDTELFEGQVKCVSMNLGAQKWKTGSLMLERREDGGWRLRIIYECGGDRSFNVRLSFIQLEFISLPPKYHLHNHIVFHMFSRIRIKWFIKCWQKVPFPFCIIEPQHLLILVADFSGRPIVNDRPFNKQLQYLWRILFSLIFPN